MVLSQQQYTTNAVTWHGQRWGFVSYTHLAHCSNRITSKGSDSQDIFKHTFETQPLFKPQQ